MKPNIFHICLFAAIAGAGCAGPNKLVQTDLYFGLSKNDGTVISDSAWNIFVRQNVTTVYPQGFTVTSTNGGWFSESDQTFHTEPSRTVGHLSSMSPSLSARIDSLREKYKLLFDQESVLRVDKKVRFNF